MRKFLIISLIFIISSCALTIKEIKNNPAKYNTKKVTISGNVIRFIDIPFTLIRIYELYDNTDTIFIVSSKSKNYQKNDKVNFEGKIYFLDKNSLSSILDLILKSISEFLLSNKLTSNDDKTLETSKIIFDMLIKFIGDNLGIIMIEE